MNHSIQHLLVLDDDQLMRDLLLALLSLDGFEITMAESGQQALELLACGATPEAVVTDLHMPGLEGLALAETLRAVLPRNTLLIGMSGSEPGEALRAAFDGFVVKPFDVQLLRNAIGTAQQRKNHTERYGTPQLASSPGMTSMVIEALDETIFQSLARMISSAQLGQLFNLALADIAKRHQRITAAADAGDLPSAQREAHAIKGSCGMLGAVEIQHLAAAIEDGNTLNTFAIAEIPAACLRLKRMLETKLQTV